jgi:hypothetical protein
MIDLLFPSSRSLHIDRTYGPMATVRVAKDVDGAVVMALSQELPNGVAIALRERQTHAAVAARHVSKALPRRARIVRRELKCRWVLKVFCTAA